MQYLIWSNEHAAWWRSGHLGYTEIISKAGRYSREEAEQICADANRYRPEGAQPHEVAVLAPESVDALEAENQRLREARNTIEMLRAELERLREIREAAVDVMGNAIRQESGDYIVFGRPLSRLIAALSQPAEQPAAQEADLPLMARQEWMGDAIGAMREEPDHVWQFYYEKDQSLMLQEASEGLEVYRIADTDEHGLPVIERTADMPEWAKYRINGERYQMESAVMPSTYFEQDWQRIEDYRHGQEG